MAQFYICLARHTTCFIRTHTYIHTHNTSLSYMCVYIIYTYIIYTLQVYFPIYLESLVLVLYYLKGHVKTKFISFSKSLKITRNHL